jgi:hypothetical protein
MSTKLLAVASGIIFLLAAASGLRADQVEMQNGDRYSGKVLSVSANTVVLQSEMLGKINVPRKNVANLAFGTNIVAPNAVAQAAPVSAPTNPPAAPALAALMKTNADLSAALRHPGADTNVIRQIREQMLAGSPEAASKYDEMVSGLLSGNLNVDDLRREAKSSADQLRTLKRDLGPEAAESLDGYLEVLDNFLKETAAEPADTARAPQPKSQVR